MKSEAVTYYKDFLGRRHVISYGGFQPFVDLNADYIKKRLPKWNMGVWQLYQGIEFKL